MITAMIIVSTRAGTVSPAVMYIDALQLNAITEFPAASFDATSSTGCAATILLRSELLPEPRMGGLSSARSQD